MPLERQPRYKVDRDRETMAQFSALDTHASQQETNPQPTNPEQHTRGRVVQ